MILKYDIGAGLMRWHSCFTVLLVLFFLSALIPCQFREDTAQSDPTFPGGEESEIGASPPFQGRGEGPDGMGGEWWGEVGRSIAGKVVSPKITVPFGMIWDEVHVVKSESSGAHVRISVMDEVNNRTFPGFENRSETSFSISNITAITIRLVANLSSTGGGDVMLVRWGVEWRRENAWWDGFIGDSNVDSSENVSVGSGGSIPAFWRFSVPVILENAGGVLSDYPVAVELNTPDFDYSSAGPNGEDLRFFNEHGTELAHWIEKWNPQGRSRIWVRMGTIPRGQTRIEMLYGNPRAGDGSCGEKVFLFFDDFQGDGVNVSKWWIENPGLWTGDNGLLTCTGNNGRLRSKARYTAPICQEVNVKIITRAANGVSVCGFYSTNGDCFGLLSHSQTDWVRNDGAWTALGGEFMNPHIWYTVRISSSAAGTVGLNIINAQTGTQVHERQFQNGISLQNVTLGRRYDDWKPAQGCEVYWDSVRVRKYTDNEPQASAGEQKESREPGMVSVPIDLPRMCLWTNLTVEKDEPGDTSIVISILNATTNEIIPGFESITNGSAKLATLNEMDITEVRLAATFDVAGRVLPSLLSWGLDWVPIEPPALIRPIPDREVDEDRPEIGILNLTEYFEDGYAARRDTLFSLESEPAPENITVSLDGNILSIREIRENWTGSVALEVKATNAYGLSSLSNLFHINVIPVNDPPEASLVHPVDGSDLDRKQIVLRWNAYDIDDAVDELKYDLYFGDTTTPYRFRSNITGQNFTMGGLEDGVTYYWCVYPRDGESLGICRSGIWRFTVSTAEVALISPDGGSALNNTEINLTWELRNGSLIGCTFRVFMGPMGHNMNEICSTKDMRCNITLPQDDHTYWWKVVAEYDGGARSIESAIRSFTSRWIPPLRHELDLIAVPGRLTVKSGGIAGVRIIITNLGNVEEEVSVEVFGELAENADYKRDLHLDPGADESISLKISTKDTEAEKTYVLTIRANYSQGSVESTLVIEITSQKGDDPDGSGSGLSAIALAAGGAVILILFIIVIISIVRRKGRRDDEAGTSLGTTGEKADRFEYKSRETPRPPTATAEVASSTLNVADIYTASSSHAMHEEYVRSDFFQDEDLYKMDAQGARDALDEPEYGLKGRSKNAERPEYALGDGPIPSPPERLPISVDIPGGKGDYEIEVLPPASFAETSDDVTNVAVHPNATDSPKEGDEGSPTTISVPAHSSRMAGVRPGGDEASQPEGGEIIGVSAELHGSLADPMVEEELSMKRSMDGDGIEIGDESGRSITEDNRDDGPSMKQPIDVGGIEIGDESGRSTTEDNRDGGHPTERPFDDDDIDEADVVGRLSDDDDVLGSFSEFLNKLPEKFSGKQGK